MISVPLQIRVAGYYKLEAIRPDGSVRPLTGWFPNLITNTGLDNLGTGGYPWTHCVVGTGNTTPSNTDTQLVTQVADTTNRISQQSSASGTTPYYGTITTTWQFPVGAAAGNLSEVGVGRSATALFSRALIVDGGGSPTTITVLSSEALNVTYVLNMEPPLGQTTGNVSLGGSNYAWTLQAASVGSVTYWAPTSDGRGFNGIGSYGNSGSTYSTQTLGAITATPGGTGYAASSSAIGTYTPGSYTQSISITWGINNGNAPGGVGSILFGLSCGNDAGYGTGGGGSYQVSFTPVIPKDNTKVLTLTFQVTWARA
jgi:hypothetical protein